MPEQNHYRLEPNPMALLPFICCFGIEAYARGFFSLSLKELFFLYVQYISAVVWTLSPSFLILANGWAIFRSNRDNNSITIEQLEQENRISDKLVFFGLTLVLLWLPSLSYQDFLEEKLAVDEEASSAVKPLSLISFFNFFMCLMLLHQSNSCIEKVERRDSAPRA